GRLNVFDLEVSTSAWAALRAAEGDASPSDLSYNSPLATTHPSPSPIITALADARPKLDHKLTHNREPHASPPDAKSQLHDRGDTLDACRWLQQVGRHQRPHGQARWSSPCELQPIAPLASTTAYARMFLMHVPTPPRPLAPTRGFNTLQRDLDPNPKVRCVRCSPGHYHRGLVFQSHHSTLPPFRLSSTGIRLRATHNVTETTPQEHVIGLRGFGDSGEGVGVNKGTQPLLRPSRFSPYAQCVCFCWPRRPANRVPRAQRLEY
ncbi:hypothetical protein FRC12_009589, partial [Ceratobasidium sp. 428]